MPPSPTHPSVPPRATRERTAWIIPLVAGALALAAALPATSARADNRPTIASDGLFIGMRLEPGVALLFAYDLDIYLTGDRLISLGPAASFAILDEDGVELGRRQDWLLTIDFLRLKVALIEGDSEIRPYLFVGGGMTYASLPQQETEPRDVLVLPDLTPASAIVRYPAIEDFGAQISFGAGFDWYLVDNFALAVGLAAHLRLTDEERLPLLWGELTAGIRFGL
ncbi:MAG: hypothetical protein AB7S26_02660 [Sandaracinaceae bacterium]